MSIDPLPSDLDALRALVSQLSSERDSAVAENRRLIEQMTTCAIEEAAECHTFACAERQATPGTAGNAPTVTDGFGYPYIKGARHFD